jgi:outer membrane protein OmpA-like peptidoglycan-associated protein
MSFASEPKLEEELELELLEDELELELLERESPPPIKPSASDSIVLSGFDFKSPRPTAAHRSAVKAIAQTVTAMFGADMLAGRCKIIIDLFGHEDFLNDRKPPGSPGGTKGLGLERAQAVAAMLKKELASLGMDRVVEFGTVQGLGNGFPVQSSKTHAGRAANRRVEVRFRSCPPPT